MAQLKPIIPGLAALSILVALERFAYYGFRSIIILFVIDELQLDSGDALYYYGVVTTLFYVACLPMGLLTDFVFGQKKGLLIGAVLLMVGYTTFTILQDELLWLSFGLLIIGSGLTKPNFAVLLGRLYPKESRQRDSGFLIYYAAVNLGAFTSALSVGLIAERVGYGFAFGVIAAVSAFLLFCSILFQPLLQSNEKNPATSHKAVSAVLIGIAMILSVGFWGGYEIIGENVNSAISNQESSSEFSPSFFRSFSTAPLIPLSILIAAAWTFWKNPSPLQKFSIAFLFCGAAYLIFHFAELETALGLPFMKGFLIYSFLIGLAEIFLAPIILSYITRLSPMHLSSSVIALYFVVSGIGNQLFGSFASDTAPSPNVFLWIGVTSIIVAAALYILKKFLKSDGIGASA